MVRSTNAGGENVARGALLGAVLGARHGLGKLPKRWVEGLVGEKEIRKEVQDALKKAKAGSQPPLEELFKDIYSADDKGTNQYPPYIRMPDRTKSREFA